MILFRLTNSMFANDLSGNGARLFGGRWNSEGRPAIYMAATRSLAVLESLAHINPTNIPDDMVLLTIEVPDDVISLDTELLPENWKASPEPHILKQIGNLFLQKNEHLLLKVPSALVPEEFNYLVNPRNPNIEKVKIKAQTPFSFDERILR